MTDPIVVGVDGSGRSLRALVWAAQTAALHRCALRIVHVLTPERAHAVTPEGRAFEASADGRDWEARERDQGIVVEATAIAREAHPELEVTSALPQGAPAAVFLAESEHAHTLVLGAKGEGGFATLALGSVALQVVGHAASPVVIVNHVPLGHRRIVVGADGSAHSQAAVAYAFEEAALRGAELRVVHAWAPPGRPALVSPVLAEAEAEHQRELDEWLAAPRREIVADLVPEAPAAALARASERTDLLVVGSRGRGGFRGLALGSVSQALLQYAVCPTAVVHPRP